MTDMITLEPHEIKTRRNWLICLIVQNLLIPFLCIIFLVCNLIFIENSEEMSSALSNIIFHFFLSLPVSGLLYYYAYKKHGTALLTYFFIGNTINLLATMSLIITNLLKGINFTGESLIIDGFDFLISVWFFWMNIQLRRVNRKIRKRKARLSPIFTTAESTLRMSFDLEDLQRNFASMVKASPEFTEELSEVFKEKKLAFNS